ncbi:MAG: FkbM family methyltransferase [Planctomycetia bacterium]
MISSTASTTPVAGLRSMPLPDGRRVATLCPENTQIAYDEIFVARIYEMFGIELAAGDTGFDVGANIGLAVLWVGDRIGHGTVHAFEPIPATFRALEQNVGRHPHLDVHLHAAGGSDRDGTATFTFYPLTSTSSSMYPDDSAQARDESNRFILADLRRRLGPVLDLIPGRIAGAIAERMRRWYQRGERVPCRLVRLSTVIRAAGVERIDLLKIDVEGAEFDVVAGIDAEHWPLVRQVIVEVHEGAESCARMEGILAAQGFRPHAWQQAPKIFPRHWLIYARREPPSAGSAAHPEEKAG